MRGVQAKRSLSKCKTTHTGNPSLEIPIPGSLKCSTPSGMGARAKEAGRAPVGQHVVAPVGIRVQEQPRKDDSFSETLEKVCKGYEIEIIFIATEVMLKTETDEHCCSSVTAHVCLGHCIKRAKPLLASVLFTQRSSALMISTCFLHSQRPGLVQNTFRKTTAPSSFSSARDYSYAFKQHSRLRSASQTGIGEFLFSRAALAGTPPLGGQLWFLSSCLSGGLQG